MSDPGYRGERISALAIYSGRTPAPDDDLTPFESLVRWTGLEYPNSLPRSLRFFPFDDAVLGSIIHSLQGVTRRATLAFDVPEEALAGELLAGVMTLQESTARHILRLAEQPHRGGWREKNQLRAALFDTTAIAQQCDVVLIATGDRRALARAVTLCASLLEDRPELLEFVVGAQVMMATGVPSETYEWRPEQGPMRIITEARETGKRILAQREVQQDVAEDRAGIVRRSTPTGRRGPHPGPSPAAMGDLAPDFMDEYADLMPLTLEVFPDLSFLPGKAKTNGSTYTAQNPLAECGHLAKLPLPLSEAPDLIDFVEALDAEFPWYRDVTRKLAGDLGRGRFAKFRHTMLFGPPGSAKTRYARRAMELAGLPVLVYSAGGTADATFGSTSRQWATGRLSVPAGLIARTKRANVGIVVDELDKLPPPGTGHNGRLDEVMLPFLEPDSAKAVFDTYVEAPLNLSAISYLATANDLSRVPGPLRDRFRLIEAPLPRPEDLPALVRSMTSEIMAEQGLDPAWAVPLAQDELDVLARTWRGGSLRGLRRMVEVMLDGRPAGLAQ